MKHSAVEAGSDPLVSGRTIVIAAIATFALVTWWSLRDADRVAGGVLSPTRAAAPDAADSAWPDGLAPAAGDATAPPPADLGVAEATFADYVIDKYRFLRRSPDLDAALLEREKLTVAINTAKQTTDEEEKQRLPRLQAAQADVDRKIGVLLAPGDLAGFEVLKNSDIEQFQFDDYVGGISHVTPLAEEDKQAILYAKLVHRHRFRQALDDSGLMRGDLTRTQRQFVFNDVSRALRESKDGFLQEARQHLYDEEQLTLLGNYENSEYTAELDKLRRIADAE